MRKRFTEERIIGLPRDAQAGLPVEALYLQHGFSEASDYPWRSKLVGIRVRLRRT
ncbi:hypothetical protein [Burkholderia gladioli]|uniref:hypothetical protein n=1 Tax=Burkholderia gladioli TaxID=28095 RepID=UPI0003058DED|nr:hypothetical protein [Burkholderia gladioli]